MKIKLSDTYTESFHVTQGMINGFAEVTGDRNPIHLDEQYGAQSIFRSRIAHGFLIGSFISSVLGNHFPGPGTVYLSQSMRFLKPVFPDDTIRVTVEVIQIHEKGWLTLKTTCTNQSDVVVITGEAMIIPPQE
jgi:3-hydroxybutyryl-CoA dehydratase